MAIKSGEAYVLFGISSAAFKAQLKGLHAHLTKSVAGMQAVAAKARMVFLMGAGAMALTTKTAASFEQGMARVRALTGATGTEFNALSGQAKQLGATTVFSARQSAEAMSYFALAGFNANKIMGAMPATLNMAAAGQIGVAQAADIAAKIMAGMGLETQELNHAVDVLTKAFTSANTDIGMLGEAFKYVGPIAKSAGRSLEETSAAIMVLSNAGIQGSSAGTALKNIFSRLSGGTREANKIFKQLGVTMTTAAGESRPLADVIDDTAKAMESLGGAQKLAMMMTAFGMRAGGPFLELVAQGGDAVREFQHTLESAGGTAQRIADIQLDTTTGAFTLLKSAMEGFSIAVGQKLLPAVRKAIANWAKWFGEMAGSEDALHDTIVGVGKLVLQFTAMLTIMPLVGSAAIAVVGSLMAFGGPITWGIMGVTAALSFLIMKFGEGLLTGKGLNVEIRELWNWMTRTKSNTQELAEATDRLTASEKELASAIKDTSAIRARVRDLGARGTKPTFGAGKRPEEIAAAALHPLTGEKKRIVEEYEKQSRRVVGALRSVKEAEETMGQARTRPGRSVAGAEWKQRAIGGRLSQTLGYREDLATQQRMARGMTRAHQRVYKKQITTSNIVVSEAVRAMRLLRMEAEHLGFEIKPGESGKDLRKRLAEVQRYEIHYRSLGGVGELPGGWAMMSTRQRELLVMQQQMGRRKLQIHLEEEAKVQAETMVASSFGGERQRPARGVMHYGLPGEVTRLGAAPPRKPVSGRPVSFHDIAGFWKTLQTSATEKKKEELDKERNAILGRIEEKLEPAEPPGLK